MNELTKTIGLEIRDILRADPTFLTLLGITAATAKNFIFLNRPVDQHQGFVNPRVVIVPVPSDADELKNTGIYQGIEIFQVQLWVDSTPVYSVAMDLLDRIVTLFNNTSYSFTESGTAYNFGVYKCTGKLSYSDSDKDNTTKGDINIALEIGGI